MRNPTKMRWVDVKPEEVDIPTFNKEIDRCIALGLRRIQSKVGGSKVKLNMTYSFANSPSRDELRICSEYGVFRRIYIRHGYEDDDLKKRTGITGLQAFNHVEELFKLEYGNDLTMYRAFSGLKYMAEYKAIKKCVPHQIAWIMQACKGRPVVGCWRADVCSAFPYQMTKTLPTLKGHRKENGTVDPTPEYPFAFYVRSGHMKIYGELDTRDIPANYIPNHEKIYSEIMPEDDETILCPVSQYSMKDVFVGMFEAKERGEEAEKMYMNAAIGYFHRNGDPRLSHLAACVIARNNAEMYERYLKLKKEGNTPLYIATDSIVWRGGFSKIASPVRKFGEFCYEGRDGKFFGKSIGAYQFVDADGTMTTKCSYLPNGEDKKNIPFGELPEMKNEKVYRDSQGRIKTL